MVCHPNYHLGNCAVVALYDIDHLTGHPIYTLLELEAMNRASWFQTGIQFSYCFVMQGSDMVTCK